MQIRVFRREVGDNKSWPFGTIRLGDLQHILYTILFYFQNYKKAPQVFMFIKKSLSVFKLQMRPSLTLNN